MFYRFFAFFNIIFGTFGLIESKYAFSTRTMTALVCFVGWMYSEMAVIGAKSRFLIKCIIKQMTYKKHFYVLIIFIATVISQQSEPQNEIAQIKGTKSPTKTGKKV